MLIEWECIELEMSLEDLSFEILNNEARELIKKKLDEIKSDTKDVFEIFIF